MGPTPLPVAVLGAGPVGLAAAAVEQYPRLGRHLVLEADAVGAGTLGPAEVTDI